MERDFSLAMLNAGSIRAARIEIIAMTTSNSTRVNARLPVSLWKSGRRALRQIGEQRTIDSSFSFIAPASGLRALENRRIRAKLPTAQTHFCPKSHSSVPSPDGHFTPWQNESQGWPWPLEALVTISPPGTPLNVALPCSPNE